MRWGKGWALNIGSNSSPWQEYVIFNFFYNYWYSLLWLEQRSLFLCSLLTQFYLGKSQQTTLQLWKKVNFFLALDLLIDLFKHNENN